MSDKVLGRLVFLVLLFTAIALGAVSHVSRNVEPRNVKVKKQELSLSTEIKELTKRELQLSIEVKELQKRKLNCEFKTKRCPNG